MNKKTLRASVRELASKPVAASPQAEATVALARELSADELAAIAGGIQRTGIVAG